MQAAIDAPLAPPPVQYNVIELGGGRANDISESGQIVGSKRFVPQIPHAAFWSSSQSAAIDLGSLSGLNSTATDINPRREIVGYAYNADGSVERPLFWASPNSAPVELPGLPAGFLSEVYNINPSGKIVGQFYSADLAVERAVFWPNSNAAPVYLAQLSDEFPLGLASNINASGNILGDACNDFNCTEGHATFWANSTSTPVALASPGAEFIYTNIFLPGFDEINGAGNMVGYAYNADFSATRAVFWATSSSPAVILSTVGEFTDAVATGISDNGQIVGIGYNDDFSKQRAFFWPSATSQAIDLTTFFPAGSNWDLDSTLATAVNNRGEIVGSGSFTDGTVHNFVLIPVHGH
jgi:probable HAF family extracellular repeat protein